MSSNHFIHSATAAFVAAVLITAVTLFGFFVLEPQVGRAVTSDPFIITQQIDGAISFKVQPNNVSMNGGSGINGLTGGNATGTSVAVIQTNSATGYIMQIAFDNEQSSMRGNVTNSQAIRDYASSTYRMVEPAFGFLASTSAMMGFTVLASTSADVDDSFKDSGGACNQGIGTANGFCYMTPDTTNFQIIDSGSSAPNGATTSIRFKIVVPNAPNPSVDADLYTATATLTATNQ